MFGVWFGDYHSWDDFRLVLGSKEIETPSVKSETIDVPGADGVLDFTDYFGEPKYKQRKIKFDFTSVLPFSEQLLNYSKIQNCIHGKRLKIVIDGDPEFYWIGRIDVGNMKQNKNIASFTVTAECEPYKLRKNKTVIYSSVTNSGTLVFENLRKRVIPKITVSDAVTIVFGSNSYSIATGSHTIPEIQFVQGKNLLEVTGTATVKVEYQEGGL